MDFVNIYPSGYAFLAVCGKPVPDVVENKQHCLCFHYARKVFNIIRNKTVIYFNISFIVKVFCRTLNVHFKSYKQILFDFGVNVFCFSFHNVIEIAESGNIIFVKSFKVMRFKIRLIYTSVDKRHFLWRQRSVWIHYRDK